MAIAVNKTGVGSSERTLTASQGARAAQRHPKSNATPAQMRGASYNCEIGRNPHAVARFVHSFAKHNDLDFIQLQEISEYHRVLKAIPGYRLITFPGTKDHGETGVLVRDGLQVKDARPVQSAVGWTNVHGRHAQPRAATTVSVAGWLHLASVHAPPGLNWKGHAVGPRQRIKSYASLMRKLLAFAKRSRGPVLVGGDWNEGAHSWGKWSPTWLARQAGLKKHPDGGIDWEMSRGCKVTNERRGPKGGSDHHAVLFTVSRPRS